MERLELSAAVWENAPMQRAEFARRLGAGSPLTRDPRCPLVIEERDPRAFQRAFATAAASGSGVFLADPGWGAAGRDELNRILQPATPAPLREAEDARGARPVPSHDRGIDLAAVQERGWLMIPSGGTGGRLKFARHDQDTVAAAVAGFCAHFDLRRVNAVGVLPLHHVSGFMAWIRCALTGGEYLAWDWKELERGLAPAKPRAGDWVISLVPTQLQRLLGTRTTVNWLRGFRAIFIGGGPAWPSLLDSAASAGLRIALSYGMTETAAMIAALRPEEFLSGSRSCGTALPHGRISLGADGVIHVHGESIFHGYFPEWREVRGFETEDLGVLDARGQLTILGRRDAMIITGGKKVNPAEVEKVLRASGQFADVAVLGIPDAEWGEAVVACYPAVDAEPDFRLAVGQLASFQRPRRFVAIRDWPRNEQGKVNRLALRASIEVSGAAASRSPSG